MDQRAEWLAYQIGKIGIDDLSYPENLAKAKAKMEAKAVSDRERDIFLLGYHAALLEWAELPFVRGEDDILTRERVERIIQEIMERNELFSLSPGVKKIAGPFDTRAQADAWYWSNEENYEPYLRIVHGFDGKYYVADPREADAKREHLFV